MSELCCRPSRNHAAWDIRDERASSRRSVVLPCQIVRERDFRLVGDRMIDLSTQGMLAPLRERVVTGERVIVAFCIDGRWIDTEATVARIEHGRRAGDVGLSAGIMFDGLPHRTGASVSAFVERRPVRSPRRSPRVRQQAAAEALEPRCAPLAAVAYPRFDGLSAFRAVIAALQGVTM